MWYIYRRGELQNNSKDSFIPYNSALVVQINAGVSLPEKVGLAFQSNIDVYKRQGLDRKFKECEVSELWPQVVGKFIASKTKNIYMTEGKLFVSFTASVVKNEILMVKEGIIAALNDRL